MAALFGEEINSRADFFKEVARAKKLANSILNRKPEEVPLKGVVRQLEAIEKWTAKGRTPTRKERKSLDMGYRMHRAYEDWDDRDIGELKDVVTNLANYFEIWPTDEQAADPKNEYLADEDDED
jgi:hypothetical protein